MPLIYTTTEGPDPNIVELLTSNQGVERPLLQDLGRLVAQLVLPGIGNQLYAPVSATPFTITLQPAIHQRGFYNLHVAVFTTTTGVGTYTSRYDWNQDNFGPANLIFGSINLATVGGLLTVSRAVYLSGSGPISFTINPVGVAGAPILNVIGTSQLIALPAP